MSGKWMPRKGDMVRTSGGQVGRVVGIIGDTTPGSDWLLDITPGTGFASAAARGAGADRLVRVALADVRPLH